ncbi:MAG TPA: type II toxin-antitoxin system VapC family toxin [Pseudonocardiaceae bacterium]
MIYLDSCAVVKLIRPEPDSAALTAWLNARPAVSVVTSVLAEIEVARALRRNSPERLAGMTAVLAKLGRIEISMAVRATAAAYSEPHLRSSDAVHLATVDHLRASGKVIDAVVTYDKRLASAAADAGHRVIAPGC